MSHVSAVIKHLGGNIVAGSWEVVVGQCTQDRALAFIFLELGRYAMVNWNLVKKMAHRP